MNVAVQKVKIELNNSEKDLVYAMYNLTNQYYEKTNHCAGLSCLNCPLNLFCYDKNANKKEVIEKVLGNIEKHANGNV